MTPEKRKEILDNNNLIINRVMEEINKKCPDSIDMVAISGSFCNGLYYEKSDLDLFILANSKEAEIISKCFILDDIGQDIYITYWDRLEEMSEYNNPFVSKLKKLDIIYTKNEDVLKRYKNIQQKLNTNMNDDRMINSKIGKYLGKVIYLKNKIQNDNNLDNSYRLLGLIIDEIEKIIYLSNKKYIEGGTKSIPKEISKMNILPNNFLENYLKLVECTDTSQIKEKVQLVTDSLKKYFIDNNIKIEQYTEKEETILVKKDITREDLIGTYEELFSNYYNKLYHAYNINNKYLSFRTMIDAQRFFDEFYNEYNIPKFNLIEKYNPNDLKENAETFSKYLSKWKKLYDTFGLEIEKYNSIDELYKENKQLIKTK